LEPEEIKDEAKLKKKLSLMDTDDLNMRLENAISEENYEQAQWYRDELRRREEG
jgi:protein-arginine kinase activator protein McsA